MKPIACPKCGYKYTEYDLEDVLVDDSQQTCCVNCGKKFKIWM